MSDPGNKNTDIGDLLSSLADDLINLMIREHQYIHQELEHVRQLVGDATKSLTASFDEINRLASNQNTAINSNSQSNGISNKYLLDKHNIADKKYRDNQLNIVTALQFDDIVQQLTKHAQNRARNIQDMFKRLEDALSELKTLDHNEDPAFTYNILKLKRDVNNFRIELEKENPVKQSSLSVGKTELF